MLVDRFDAFVVGIAGRVGNYPSFRGAPRVTVEQLRTGGVAVALSVLLCPLLELGSRLTRSYGRRPPYGRGPEDFYFPTLLRQADLVERRIAERHADRATVARTADELDAGIAAGKLVLIHCVEGGFHLGATVEQVELAVAELARRGVAYITLAHLFWRHVATVAPAVPFLSDSRYGQLFPQPGAGLTELGRAAVRTMVRAGVLVDVTHMSGRALADTFTPCSTTSTRASP